MYEKNSINWILCKFRGIMKSCTYRPGHGGDVQRYMGIALSFPGNLGALLPFGKSEITIGVEESSLCPSPCVFTPTIYFLHLKETFLDTLLKWDRMHWRRQKARGSRDSKISGLLYLILRPIEPMVSLLCERTREWRPTVHAWQLCRKSHMLKCCFFPLLPWFSPS